MKSGIKLIFFAVLLLLGVQSVFADLCKYSNAYYDECYNGNEYLYVHDYDHLDSGYYSEACYDARGNYYSCDKINYHDDNLYYSRHYVNYYETRGISIHYRDIYGNYVTEERPDYTRRYYDYSTYSSVYNNPYYPDYYVYQNTGSGKLEDDSSSRTLTVYIR